MSERSNLQDQRDRLQRAEQQRQAADRQHLAAIAELRQHQRNCYAGSISACTAAIASSHVAVSERSNLQSQRDRLQQAEQQRQAADRQHLAAIAELRQHQRNCYAGSITACTAAITSSHVAVSERSNLATQRDRLQRAEERREAAERQRQAAIREYERLRTDCAGGKRSACAQATAHAQARSSDIAFLKQRERDLAPFTERLANLFTKVNLANGTEGGSGNILGPALLGLLALAAAGFGTIYVVGHRAPMRPAEREPPSLAPQESPAEPPATAVSFPLTGHMPTDVRRALAAANT